ncbi:MAG: MerR family transcriptional regulator [Candidatus Baltobacteraceae bacterium]
MKNTIGKIAAAAGVSVETIRFYQREGMLEVPARTQSGWREYGDHHLRTIAYIKGCQRLGLSLADMKPLLSDVRNDGSFCLRVRSVSRERLTKIERDIRELLRTRRAMRATLARCEAVKEFDQCPTARTLLAR